MFRPLVDPAKIVIRIEDVYRVSSGGDVLLEGTLVTDGNTDTSLPALVARAYDAGGQNVLMAGEAIVAHVGSPRRVTTFTFKIRFANLPNTYTHVVLSANRAAARGNAAVEVP